MKSVDRIQLSVTNLTGINENLIKYCETASYVAIKLENVLLWIFFKGNSLGMDVADCLNHFLGTLGHFTESNSGLLIYLLILLLYEQ